MIAAFMSVDVEYRFLPFDKTTRLMATISGKPIIVGRKWWACEGFVHNGPIVEVNRDMPLASVVALVRESGMDAIIIGGERLLRASVNLVDVVYMDLYKDPFTMLNSVLAFDPRNFELEYSFVEHHWNRYTWKRR